MRVGGAAARASAQARVGHQAFDHLPREPPLVCLARVERAPRRQHAGAAAPRLRDDVDELVVRRDLETHVLEVVVEHDEVEAQELEVAQLRRPHHREDSVDRR
eukprot:3735415-Prymnesium_polylepis.1